MNATMTLVDRKDRLILERIHDPYKATRKLPEPSVCPDCHAVFRGGRWQWAKSWPTDSNQELCQACRRVRDNCPAGIVNLHGEFLRTHRNEIVNVVRNQDRQENAEHPLHRIMKIEEGPLTLSIQTTDIHLPRSIGDQRERRQHQWQSGFCLREIPARC